MQFIKNMYLFRDIKVIGGNIGKSNLASQTLARMQKATLVRDDCFRMAL